MSRCEFLAPGFQRNRLTDADWRSRLIQGRPAHLAWTRDPLEPAR